MFVLKQGNLTISKSRHIMTLLHFGRHFFAGKNHESESKEVYHFTGSQLDNRKLFPRGPHSY